MSKGQRDLFSTRPAPVERPKMTALPEAMNFNGTGEERVAPTAPSAPKKTTYVPIAPMPPLGVGDSSYRIVMLQEALVAVDAMSQASADLEHGTYGQGTADAVRKLEKTYGQCLTGKYDSAVYSILKAKLSALRDSKPQAITVPPVPSEPVKLESEVEAVRKNLPSSTFKRGDTGDGVDVIQATLVKIGYLSESQVVADAGKFGDNTEEAIRRIEKEYNAKPMGYYDSFVRNAMEEIAKGEAGKSAWTPQTPTSSKPTTWSKEQPAKYVRKTSASAYKAIVEEGTLGRLQKKVYAKLYDAGPMTANEINQACLEEGEVTPGYHKRLSELERMGIAKRVGIRKCAVSGRECETWDVTDSLPVRERPKMQKTYTIFAVGSSPEGALASFCDAIGWKPKEGSIVDLTKAPHGLTWAKTFFDEATQQDVTVGGCELPGGFTLTYMK